MPNSANKNKKETLKIKIPKEKSSEKSPEVSIKRVEGSEKNNNNAETFPDPNAPTELPKDKLEKIREGLQIPTEATRELKKNVKKVIVEPKMTEEELKKRQGTYFDDKEVDTIYDEDVDVYAKDPTTGEEKLVAKFRKNVLDKDLIKLGWESFYITAAPSRNRGAAAGPINVEGAYWKKRKPTEITGWAARYMQNGKVSKMKVNNNVFSSVLGYFEKTPFMKLPCRLTSYTQKYFKTYKRGIPFIEELNRMFKELLPDRYKAQHDVVKKKPMYQIGDTAFSSVTINRNFRTALHQDAGDYRPGFGNLSVIERGKYHGGNTLFPRYKIGFNIRTGDFIEMDVHDWHCNTEMYETAEDKEYNKTLPRVYFTDPSTGTLGADKLFTRISFVCYFREKLQDCKETETRKYYNKIHFDPATNSQPPRRQTRKKKNEEEQQE
jgi:hypothetical protein